MQVTKQTRQQLRIQNIIFYILFLGTVGLLAWFSTQHSFTSDWTYGGRNSLTQSSIDLLGSLDGEINLNVYLPDQDNLRISTEELLRRYQQHKKDFNYRILNPDLEPELSKADNITQYGQTVIKYKNKKETIDSLSESNLSNALSRLSRNSTPLALFLDKHGERDPLATNNLGYSSLASALATKGFAVDRFNLLQGPLPENTRVLVIAGPSHDYLPGEVARIQDYVKTGGNLLWLQDPGELHGLEPLASDLHIEFHKGTLVDADPVLRATLRIEHPAMIAVMQYNLHDITRKIPYNTLFMLAGVLEYTATDDADWNVTTLFSSRESTWSETSSLLTKEITFDKDKNDKLGPSPMALAMQRKLSFGSKPETEAATESKTEPANKDIDQRIVIVADSDFLANSYIGAGANKMLGENIFNWLSKDEQLLSIDIKNAPDLRLDLGDSQVAMIGIVFLLVIPIGLLASGFILWNKRRKR